MTIMKGIKRQRSIEVRFRNLVTALHYVLSGLRISELPSRVRELPDERTLRFYSSTGLLSPPLRLDGRRAMYGPKHLLQLVAIKRLQARQLTIKEIRPILTGVPTAKLADIAAVNPAVLWQALDRSARDPALDLWPRSRRLPESSETEPSSVDAGGAAGGGSGGRTKTYRVSEGVYLLIDPAESGLPHKELCARIKTFVDSKLQEEVEA